MAWEQTYLPIVAHSAVTSTNLNKSNGKRLCRKISLLRNKCDAMIAKSYERRRHKKGSSESSVFTEDAFRPEDWGHSGGLWTMTNGCVSVTADRITGYINNCFIKFPLYICVIICPFHPIYYAETCWCTLKSYIWGISTCLQLLQLKFKQLIIYQR